MTPEERAEIVARQLDAEHVTVHFRDDDNKIYRKTFQVSAIIAAAISEAVAEEREASAGLADALAAERVKNGNNHEVLIAMQLAAAIRARSQEDKGITPDTISPKTP